MNYYFAYGSNMDLVQMKERCRDALLIGPAKLENYELQFTIYSPQRKCGCADIVPKEETSVWGLVFEMTDADMLRMDGCEGHPIHYKRCTVTVTTPAGTSFECISYEVVQKEPNQVPSKDYLGKLTTAGKEFSFPQEYRIFLNQFPTLDK